MGTVILQLCSIFATGSFYTKNFVADYSIEIEFYLILFNKKNKKSDFEQPFRTHSIGYSSLESLWSTSCLSLNLYRHLLPLRR